MRLFLISFLVLFGYQTFNAQEISVILGKVLDSRSREPLSNCIMYIEDTQVSIKFGPELEFRPPISLLGAHILNIFFAQLYHQKNSDYIGKSSIGFRHHLSGKGYYN